LNQLFASEGNFSSGFFNPEKYGDRYSVTMGVCKIDDPSLKLVAPVVWIGRFHTNSFPDKRKADKDLHPYRTSSGLIL